MRKTQRKKQTLYSFCNLWMNGLNCFFNNTYRLQRSDHYFNSSYYPMRTDQTSFLNYS